MVSSANSLTVEAKPFGKSLMYVRNKSGPSTDPWGTPEVTGEEVDVGVANGKIRDLPRRRDRFLKFETETCPISKNPSPRLNAEETEPET